MDGRSLWRDDGGGRHVKSEWIKQCVTREIRSRGRHPADCDAGEVVLGELWVTVEKRRVLDMLYLWVFQLGVSE